MSKRGNIIQLFLLISVSVELNPGPDIKYKCIECYKSVNIGQSIACDNCNQWFHKSCLNMNSINFESYRNDNTQEWICYKCGIINISTSIFETSFDSLDSAEILEPKQ